MLTQLLRPQSRSHWHYLVLGAVVLGIFAGGLLIGNLLNSLFETSNGTSSGTAASTQSTQPGGAAVVTPPHRVQDFTLTSHTGKSLSLSDLRGQAVLLFFGYTHCPDVCPTTLADYRRIKQTLGEAASEVEFVFISVDGSRDTPDVMAEYLSHFDTDFIGLTGDEDLLARIGNEYGLMFSADAVNVEHEHTEGDGHTHDDAELNSDNYFVNHTSPSFLIDPDGYLRLVYFYGTAPEVIAEGIRQMVRS